MIPQAKICFTFCAFNTYLVYNLRMMTEFECQFQEF